MISYIGNVQKGQIHGDRKQTSSCQELRREQSTPANWYEVSFQGDENVLSLIAPPCE